MRYGLKPALVGRQLPPSKDLVGGQVALPFVLLVSGIILEIAVAGAIVAYFFSSSSLGERLLVRAAAAANSGMQDALARIAQNKHFISALADSRYCLTVDSDTAYIALTRTTNSAAGAYVYTVDSLGVAGARYKRLLATIDVDQTTGEVRLKSITDEPASSFTTWSC